MEAEILYEDDQETTANLTDRGGYACAWRL
jgi:hypothetical protein